MFKQHRELSMFVHSTIETNEEARIRPSKTYQSFITAADSYRELSFIEKDVRNYITREVRNVSKQDDAKEFRKAIRRLAYIDSSLPGSPLLGRDEKHTKEREHARIFQQVHHTQHLLESICEIIRQLSSKQRAKNERIRRCRFLHRDIVRNKISNRGSVSACIYPREVQGSSRTIQRKGELHHKISEFHPNFTFNKFFVTYDAVSREVKCQCLLFESRAILCHHSLSFLSFEPVDNMAPKYILECWSKNIKRRHTHIKSIQDEPLLELRSKRFDNLVFRSHNIC
ncbi:hypothetical protein Ahy_A02g007334 [Arachis hypogaea]|uniref:Protein FAR1-RELATED SEQUENCE n=1 Tax=Arachis hypogaea TaxID=3818 RepID=A0A445EC26_ARAHY|nr:hypothetical protein Ahy_A02g007334 [Arachis hypogaea]